MDFVCAALLLLVSAASCAPAPGSPPDACARLRSSSAELNHLARSLLPEVTKVRGGSKDLINGSTSLQWIESKDMCDPGSLRHTPELCVEKMFSVLMTYKSTLAGFHKCSQFSKRVNPLLQKLHDDMQTCWESKKKNVPKVTPQPAVQATTHDWQDGLLCQYSLQRLFSFSILAARVFAVGDPSLHADGSAASCPM